MAGKAQTKRQQPDMNDPSADQADVVAKQIAESRKAAKSKSSTAVGKKKD